MVDVDVVNAGTYGFLATLRSGTGDLLASGSLDSDFGTTSPRIFAPLNAGVTTIPVYFSGETLYDSGVNGPYQAEVLLIDADGLYLDGLEHTTAAYESLGFEGIALETTTIQDSGSDTDGISGYNYLHMDIGLNVIRDTSYMVSGDLYSGEDLVVSVTVSGTAAAGTTSVSLDFPGEPIALWGVDGPYTVSLSVSDLSHIAHQVYETAAYGATEFQYPNAIFTGNSSDAGQDADGNGLYDTFEVQTEVVALKPGDYTVRGVLEDGDGTFIGSDSATLPVDSTGTIATLSFDGLDISRHGVDGPYHMAMSLLDSGGQEIANSEHTTSAYLATEFESPAATFDGSFSDEGVDIDGDGLFNVLRIDVGLEVASADTYRVEGSLHTQTGLYVGGADVSTSFGAGSQVVSLDFSGTDISESMTDGPYALMSLELLDSDGKSIHTVTDAFTTQAYVFTDFQPGNLALTGEFADYGTDADGNGFIDTLDVEIQVLVSSASYYYYNARLMDSLGKELVWASASSNLTLGLNWIVLSFDGRYIYGNGVDGHYDVKDLSVYSASDSLTEIDVYTTGFYEWDQFEPTAIIRGSVVNNNAGVEGANLYILGQDSDVTAADGSFVLNPIASGTYDVVVEADAALEPWYITVNGSFAGVGTTVSVAADVGAETEVTFLSAADEDGDGFSDADGDCNDENMETYPGATELCNGSDDDCDGEADEDFDADQDGYFSTELCVDTGGDCDDTNPMIYPGAGELCDGLDNDCDAAIDEDFDQDEDGYLSLASCPELSGDDCDDADPMIFPGASELCDDRDNDCDSLTDEDFDVDGDGYLSEEACSEIGGDDCNDENAEINPGVDEVPADQVDNDCDGEVDEYSPGDCAGGGEGPVPPMPAYVFLLPRLFGLGTLRQRTRKS